MGHSTYVWVKAFHIVGILIWAGTMMGLANNLVAVGRSGDAARPALLGLARSAAMMMDIGATVTIACAVFLAVKSKAFMGDQWPMKMPWMHVKLTLVVVIIGFHGFLRVKLGKYRKGKETKPVRPLVVPLLSLSLIAIVIFAVAKPIG